MPNGTVCQIRIFLSDDLSTIHSLYYKYLCNNNTIITEIEMNTQLRRKVPSYDRSES